MKNILLSVLLIICLSQISNAQCATNYTPTSGTCSGFGDEVDSYILNSISAIGNAGCSPNAYSFYNTPVWNLQVGASYPFSANVGNGTWSEGFAIWIDLNNNGFFTSNEMLFSATTPATSHSGSITIPTSAVVGTNIRMRIRCAFNYVISGSDACADAINSTGEGETEDYLVNLTCPATGMPSLTVAATSTLVCLGGTVALTATGASNYTWTGGAGITNGVPFSPTSSITYSVLGGANGCPSYTATAIKTISVTSTPLTVSGLSTPNLVCSTNPASLTAGGANNYTWMPGNLTGANVIVNPLSTTIYTLIGYNGNGCPGITTVSVGVNPNPTLGIAASSTLVCDGSPVTFTVTGAQTYTWAQGNSNLPVVTLNPVGPTLFSVSGTNLFGCTSSTSQVVLTTPSPTITITSSALSICAGGTSTLVANGANSYAWSSGPTTNSAVVNPIVTTVYTVIGTSSVSGCGSTKTVSINVFSQNLTVTPPSTVCAGTTLTIQATGATAYFWSNGLTGSSIAVTPIASTVYIVSANTVTNSMNCASSGTVIVSVNQNPTVTTSATRSVMCKGEKNTITASGASSYVWNNGTNTNTLALAPTTNTTYVFSVIGTDNNGCVNSSTITMKVNACTGIETLDEAETLLSVFPNPNNGSFTLRISEPSAGMQAKIYNAIGELVATYDLSKENTSIDLEKEARGVYYVSLFNHDLFVKSVRVIKQ